MTAEALIGWSEAGFLAVGLIAILLLMVHVFHPANRQTMQDHANIIFRGEDAPEPLQGDSSNIGRTPYPFAARQD